MFGSPLRSESDLKGRLPKWKALPRLRKRLLSSVAYATQAILSTPLGVGATAMGWLMPISFAIVGLLAPVTLSFRVYLVPDAKGSPGRPGLVRSSRVAGVPPLSHRTMTPVTASTGRVSRRNQDGRDFQPEKLDLG